MNIIKYKFNEILEIDGELFRIEFNERFMGYEVNECGIDGDVLDD